MKEKEQDFEGALKKLERIVEELENGELPLSEAIKKYEEGMRLCQFCTKRLHDIQKKIEVLVKDSSGNLSVRTFSEKDVEKIKTGGGQEQEERRKANPSTSLKVGPEQNREAKKRAEELLF